MLYFMYAVKGRSDTDGHSCWVTIIVYILCNNYNIKRLLITGAEGTTMENRLHYIMRANCFGVLNEYKIEPILTYIFMPDMNPAV